MRLKLTGKSTGLRLCILALLGFILATPAWGALGIDATVSRDQGTASKTVTTPAFSTSTGNELLLAFMGSDFQPTQSSTNVTVTGVTGGGLTWVLVRRANAQSGMAEIWRAFAPTALSNVTVTATLSQTVQSSMTVMSFAGVDTSGTNGSGAIGATNAASAASGAPTASLVTTRNNSWVVGAGNDYDRAVARTVGTGQTLVHQYLSPINDTYWVQRRTAVTPASGTTVAINDTAPTTDRYNLAIAEILPANSAPVAPQFTSLNNANFVVGNSGTFTATATGSPAPTFSETGALPTGVTFTAGGLLSGTPAAGSSGTYPLTLTAQNGVSPNATQSFTLTVRQAPAITSLNNTTFVVGSAGTFTVTATGFPAPTLSETGALPGGVGFDTATGILSGTPTASGSFPITFTAQNGVSPNATQSFTLTVNQAPTAPTITSSSSTTFVAGTLGSFTVTATGFPAPTFSETGALPTGVTLSTAGLLRGTPAAGTGGPYPVTITAQNGVSPDATQSFTLTVNQAPAITSTNNTTFVAGSAGSFTVTATGFPAPTLSETGALPGGVAFDTASGILSGTPTASGTFPITFTAQNSVTPNATQNFTLTVNGPPTPPAITSTNSTTFTAGTAGSFTIVATGSPAPTFSEVGALPAGVTLTTAGVLSGTPAAGTGGTYPVTVTAQNGVSPDATQSFTLTVNQAPAISSLNHATFAVGSAGSFSVTATGFPAATFSETGALPGGVGFDTGTGILSGTPTASGTFPLTFTALNGVGANATQSFTLSVNPPPTAPAITSTNSTTFTVGSPGSFTVTATGFPAPTFTEAGTMPAGVTLTTAGVLSGTPAGGTNGTYLFTITAQNGVGANATQNFTLTVNPATVSLSMDITQFKDNGTASNTIVSPVFSTSTGNELLLAFMGSDFQPTQSSTNVTVTGVTGGGLTWVLVRRANAQSGMAEIWRAFAPTALSNVTVTATLSQTVQSSMTVMSFAGVDTSGTNGSGAIGATNAASAASGAPTASLVTTRNNSWVVGAGNDYDRAVARTVGTGQTLVHQYLSPINDTYWVQRQTSPTALSGTTVTINDTAPTTDRYNLAIAEILSSPGETLTSDLTVTKNHSGTFAQGQLGAAYTITVRNSGSSSTSGTVTMADSLPAGLSATAISGTNWNCTLATLTCTRSDALAAGTNYPVITLTVNVAGNAPASVTNTATVSGGAELNAANDSASDLTTITTSGTITLNHVGGASAHPVVTNQTFGFNYTPVGTNNALAIMVGCRSPNVTSMTLAAPGWTFTSVSGLVGPSGIFDYISTFGAITPNTATATFTVTLTGGNGDCTGNDTTIMVDEFSGADLTGGTTTFDAHNESLDFTGSTICAGAPVTPVNNNDAIWYGCFDNVTGVNSGYVKGQDDATGDWTEYKILSGGAGIAQNAGFNTNPNFSSFGLGGISIRPASAGGTPVAPLITSTTSTTFTVGSLGSFTVTATGSPVPTFSRTGALPTGVTFSTGGVLSGTPAAGTNGTYPITITAQNGVLPNATQNFTLTVNLAQTAPVITSTNGTTFVVGTAGSFTVTATGSPTPTFSRTGTLPMGVTFSTGGVLSGTPAAGTNGTYPITITAQNGVTPNATQNFTLTVNVAQTAPVITSTNGTTFVVGTAGSFTVTATGSPTPTFSRTGALPSGVTFSTGGVLSGTPAAGTNGTYPITITAQNGVTPNATQNFTLTVNAAATTSITLTQSNVNGFEAGTANLSVAFNSNNTAGSFLIITGTAARPATTLTISDTQNNTYVTAFGPVVDTAQDVTVYVWYVANCKGGANTVKITPSVTAALELHISEWTGIASTSPVDQVVSATGTGTSVSSGARTTTTNGELIYGKSWVFNTASPGTGFTSISLVNGDLDEYLIQPTAGSIAATFTQTSGTWFSAMVTFKSSATLVTMTSPGPGTTIGNKATVAADLTGSGTGITGVQFQLDGNNLGSTIASAPYSLVWDTATANAGTHTLTAVAHTSQGTNSTSAPITVTVDNSGNPAVVGQWSPVVNIPAVAMNLALLHNNKILFYQDGSPTVWDYINNAFTSAPAPANLFCSGFVAMSDGRIFVMGGFGGSDTNIGIPDAEIFDPATNGWTSVPKMAFSRWYPTGTILSDGRILVTAGWQTSEHTNAGIPEIYNPTTNSWTRLNSANNPFETYPFIYLLPDGRVGHFGGSEYATNTDVLNISTQAWSVVDSRIIDGGSSAMYLPGKIMKAGSAADSQFSGSSSNTTFVLDMTQPSPAWQQKPSMVYPRSFLNVTSLPDGTVLATGGETDKNGGDISKAIYAAELWSPQSGAWSTMSSMQTPREYHSTALLLPDGRVVVSGMGFDFGMVPNEMNAEFFSPPYLFKGSRPTITQAPASVSYGQNFFVATPDGATISSAVLIRTGATTHFFDQSVRFVPVTFQQTTGGLTVQAPANGNAAPPGYYMLFIVNANGVPSIAPFVQVH